mmetsp:Transcript_6066/g.21271  ORF Transcript_6066/g.21271 Transcript_6066/m.21271 type:complete len:232 (+) Transcript_6066:393-1088(+)
MQRTSTRVQHAEGHCWAIRGCAQHARGRRSSHCDRRGGSTGTPAPPRCTWEPGDSGERYMCRLSAHAGRLTRGKRRGGGSTGAPWAMRWRHGSKPATGHRWDVAPSWQRERHSCGRHESHSAGWRTDRSISAGRHDTELCACASGRLAGSVSGAGGRMGQCCACTERRPTATSDTLLEPECERRSGVGHIQPLGSCPNHGRQVSECTRTLGCGGQGGVATGGGIGDSAGCR